MHIALSYQELQFILVPILIFNLYWRGSLAVGECCGTENILSVIVWKGATDRRDNIKHQI